MVTQADLDSLDRKLTEVARSARRNALDLSREIEQLRRRVDGAADVRARQRQPRDELSASQRQAEATALGEWVAWLVRTYDLEQSFPLCRQRHPGLVEELRGLRRWRGAVDAEFAADPRAATEWHEALAALQARALPAVVMRCGARHHEPVRDVGEGDTAATPGERQMELDTVGPCRSAEA